MGVTTESLEFDILDWPNCSLSTTQSGQNVTSCSSNSSVNITTLNDWLDLIENEGTTAYKLYFAYKLWYFLIDAILILPTIFGNMLIIVSLIRFKNLRKTKAFILIGNLGVSDLLVGLVLIPLDLILLLKPTVAKDRNVCLLYYCIIYTLITASVLNLLLLSLERFHAIIRPFQHNSIFTAKRIYYLAFFTWIFVIIVGFIPFFLLGSGNPYYVEGEICRNAILFDATYKLVMSSIIIVSLGISFGFFIVVIRIALRKSARKTTELGNTADHNSTRHHIRRDIRHTRLMIIVSGSFIVCWAPFCIISFVPNSSLIALIRNWLASLGIINSCLNWIVYGARNKRFRAAFKSILSCSCRKQGDVKITSHST